MERRKPFLVTAGIFVSNEDFVKIAIDGPSGTGKSSTAKAIAT
ncbi:MAG: hypothetical protein FJW76_06430, partial [Actinobacteria bacterium]|nr:hypothetical protein [Actinomycetota bacterium]